MHRTSVGHVRQAAARGRQLRLIAFALVLAVPPAEHPAFAQGVDCAALHAQIGSARGGGGEQFAEALRQQQDELWRTQDYFDSIGCGSGLFGGGPPQCSTLNARMGRMQANIIRLQDQTQDARGGGDARRRALVEQFNTICSTGAFEGRDQGEDGQVMPVDPDAPRPGDGEDTQTPPEAAQSQIKALCVRSCDGGYFPITDDASASDASLDHLGQLCKAMCPGTDATLYTTAPSGGIDTASARDGSLYTALPTAFKFQKSYDATCSCKPPHQSWAEALAGAEALIHNDKADVTVTQTLSDRLSTPSEPKAPAAKPTRKPKAAARKPKSEGNIADQTGIVIPPPQQDGEDLTRQFR